MLPRVLPRAVLALVGPQVLERELADLLVLGGARGRVEEQAGVDPSVRRGDHRRSGAERPDHAEDTFVFGGCHAVGLVQDDEVGDGEVPVGLGVPVAGGVELGRVHDLDEPSVHRARIVAGEDHPDEFLRLGEAARLDDDEVDPRGGAAEPLQIAVEFARVDGAAQTAVAEGDRGADLAGDGHGVDLDGAEVVDDDGDTVARPAAAEGG